MLNILITAGGTSEKIDDVRRITNTGTGALGAKVAEAFAETPVESGEGRYIVYICSERAVRPRVAEQGGGSPEQGETSERGEGSAVQSDTLAQGGSASAPGDALEQGGAPAPGDVSLSECKIEVRVADDVRAVEAAVRRACAETSFDIIVHSMAISDYQVRAVSDADLIAQVAAERLSALKSGDPTTGVASVAVIAHEVREALLSPPGLGEAKISSDKENLVVILEKAPKVISLLRGLAPGAVVVGFKLLSGAYERALVGAAHALLEKNDCDFVLANDMKTVSAAGSGTGSDAHEGLLVARDGTYERALGKDAIAALIVRRATEAFLRQEQKR